MTNNMLISSSLPSLKVPYITRNIELYLCYALFHLNIAKFRTPPVAFLSKSYDFYLCIEQEIDISSDFQQILRLYLIDESP
jgi:hypothetical protein